MSLFAGGLELFEFPFRLFHRFDCALRATRMPRGISYAAIPSGPATEGRPQQEATPTAARRLPEDPELDRHKRAQKLGIPRR